MPSSYFDRLLALGGRVFKTDMRYLLSGGFWSSVGQFAASGSSLAISLIFSRLLPKEAYGEYKFVLAFVAVLGALCLNGLGTAVFQSTARGFGGSLPEGFKKNFQWSIVVFIGAFVCGGYYLYLGNSTLGIGILLGGLLSPIWIGSSLYTSFLSGERDFKRHSLYADVFGTIIPAVLLLITVFFTRSPLAIIAVYFISNTLTYTFFYFRTLSIYKERITAHDPEMITYAKHQSVLGILSSVAGNVDQLFLFHFAGAAEVAIYTFAIGILDQSKGPLKSLDSMIQARFAGRNSDDIAGGMKNKMLWLFIVSVVFVGVYIIAAPFIYDVLFPNYKDAVLYSQVYALSLLGLAFSPAGSYLNAKKKVGAQYINTIFTSVLQIVFMLVGVVCYGLWGLIIARVFIRLFGTWFSYFLYTFSIARSAE